MRFLFLIRNPVYARNFEQSLALLAERGHQVHIAVERSKKGFADEQELLRRLHEAHPSITFGRAATVAESRTQALATRLRMARNLLRFLEPRYSDATKLRARAEAHAPAFARAAIPLLRTPAARRALDRALARADARLPVPREIERFLRKRRPDVLAVTPLVQFHSAQIDYVRAAKRLGVPTALCVFSWDNLTNKGLMQEVPDLVTVWNEAQRGEAVELHGALPERVEVTGAAAYDHWFGWQPRSDREAWLERVGLPADRPYLLYLCSSAFIAPEEVSFVRRWVTGLRERGGAVGQAGVLVRPHPMNVAQWRDADLSDLPAVALHPREGADPRNADARAEYFDSIFHAAAVVGINTSAQIESAIVGRSVHTVLDSAFRETQEGTLHFAHLAQAGGGLLEVGRDLDEHHANLERALADPQRVAARNRAFLEAFVRPHGLDRPAAPRVADALERLTFTRAGPRHEGEGGKGATAPKRATSPAAILASLVEDVDAVAASDGPVLAGPWTSEVGFELLYWIPLLRWACRRHPGLSDRLVALSRGGSGCWYADVATQTLDAFEWMSPEEVVAARAATSKQKQTAATGWEAELVERAAQRLGARPALLHPGVMYRAFKALFKLDAVPAMLGVLEHTAPRVPEGPPELEELLPEKYVAVRFYFSFAFQDSPQSRAHVGALLRRLAGRGPVVVLNPGLVLDDHSDLEAEEQSLVRIDHLMRPRNNLALQTRVIAGASAFVGTYGGLSYLPSLAGVDSLSFYTDDADLNACHAELAGRVFGRPQFGQFLPLHLRQARMLEDLLGTGAFVEHPLT